MTNPPVGQKPSKPLSQYYRCLHCHNIAREDRRLTVQDPDAREQWLRSLKLTDPTKRDGTVPSLTVATTLWGAVNRASFYNGYHKKYHRLAVKDDEAMDPSSLTDAIEVCCRYCSSGRFPEQWELDSMLAFLWSLELRLKDVDLAPSIRRRVLSAWKNNGLSPALKNLLRKVYLRKSGATLLPMPSSVRGATDAYDDDKACTGNAKSGQFLYATACAGCHGTVHSSVGRSLARTSDQYCRFVLRGTERDGQYMPFFTQQRLSRRQLADIRAYLQQATK